MNAVLDYGTGIMERRLDCCGLRQPLCEHGARARGEYLVNSLAFFLPLHGSNTAAFSTPRKSLIRLGSCGDDNWRSEGIEPLQRSFVVPCPDKNTLFSSGIMEGG